MKLTMRDAMLLAGLAATPVCALGATAPNEDNCRTAIAQGLETLRRIEPSSRPRDEEDRKRLLAEMERLVEANRRQGVSECRTWTQMMGKAFNQ